MQVQISELFVEEKRSLAVLNFLRSTGVGRTVPREDGGEEEEEEEETPQPKKRTESSPRKLQRK